MSHILQHELYSGWINVQHRHKTRAHKLTASPQAVGLCLMFDVECYCEPHSHLTWMLPMTVVRFLEPECDIFNPAQARRVRILTEHDASSRVSLGSDPHVELWADNDDKSPFVLCMKK